jgi:CubicO group peptidase (beta-lactamase class C family)
MNFRMGRMVVAVFVALSFHAAVAQPLEFPATRPGEIAKAYFEAFNAYDAAIGEQFAATYRAESSLAKRPAAERGTRLLQLHDQIGALIPMAITTEREHSITIAARSEKMNMWLGCTFELETETPFKLIQLTIQPTSPPDMSLSDTGSELEWETLAELIEGIREESGIPAIAVAIVEDDRVSDVAVAGLRTAGGGDTITVDDGFHIGSIGKSMTATMIAYLIENGVLEWDSTVGDVFVDVKMHTQYRDATVEQLLQHRSGLPGFLIFDDAEEARLNAIDGNPSVRRSLFVAEVLSSEPVAPLGAEMNYSNGGYVVAGHMAERATGKSWEVQVQRYVFDVVGMTHSGFGWPATPSRPDGTQGHTIENGAFAAEGLQADYPHDAWLAPAGNIFASITDLANYARFHLAGLSGRDGWITAATVRRLHTPSVEGADGRSYAAGWAIEETAWGDVHTHSGSAGSFLATVDLYPADNRAIVLALNVGPEAMAVSERVRRLINERYHTAAAQ